MFTQTAVKGNNKYAIIHPELPLRTIVKAYFELVPRISRSIAGAILKQSQLDEGAPGRDWVLE
jgi:hypothetical protein